MFANTTTTTTTTTTQEEGSSSPTTRRKQSKTKKNKRKSQDALAPPSDGERTAASVTETPTKRKKHKSKTKKESDPTFEKGATALQSNDSNNDDGEEKTPADTRGATKTVKKRKRQSQDRKSPKGEKVDKDIRMDDDDDVVDKKPKNVSTTDNTSHVEGTKDDCGTSNDDGGGEEIVDNDDHVDDVVVDDGDDDDDDDDSGNNKSNSDDDDTAGQADEGPGTALARNSSPVLPPLQQVGLSSSSSRHAAAPVIVLLDQASLETVKNRKGHFELLNCDDHRDLCRFKLRKDPKQYRPDIAHQELLALIDSPLNRAGRLQVYVKTTRNVLIQVHASVRIPRTYKRFSGLVVQLLHKLKIKSSGGNSTTLLKVVKNPFSQYLAAGTRVFGMSCKGRLYSPHALASSVWSAAESCPPVAFVIGAMATGSITQDDHPYIEEMVSISEYPLSGAAAIARLLGAMEHCSGIV